MEKTSGISVLNGQMSIRGGSGFSYGVGSRVLMLIDDMPMISGDAGDIKWNYMPVENVNQVEIIKGASSALYGSSALNGVINLRTRFPGNEPRTEITTFSGMYMDPRRKEMIWWDRNPGFLGTSFSHLRKIGRLDLSLGGNYYKNEGYRELEHEDRIRGNLGLRYTFEKVKGLSAGLNMSAMHLNVADFLFWQNADSGAYRQNPDSYAPLVGHRYNIDPYLEYHNSEGDRHSLRTRLYSVGNANLDESFSSFSKIWYADYRYLNRIGQYFNWTNGFSFMRNTVRAGLFDEHMGSNSALYSQLDAQPFDRLKMSAGIRWEVNTLNNDLFIAKPVARAGLNFQLGKASFLRASFGQGYRFPSVAEMFAEARLSGFKIFGNPELGSETGWSAEMGIKQGFSIGSVNGYLDLAAFWTEYQDMIEYTFGYYPPDTLLKHPSEYVGYKALNIENARIMGAEISAIFQGKLGPVDMYVTAGYTFMDPVDPMMLDSLGRADTTGYTILKYRRKHLFKSDLSLKFKGLSAGVNLQYNSRMIRVDEAFIDWRGELLMPGFPDYWANKAGDYLLVDLRLGWEITPAFRISAILKNAGNNEYLGRPGDIGPPRNITLQAKFTF
jgi:iron complex outermembrane receptor protein